MIVFAVVIAALIFIMNLSVHVETKLIENSFSLLVRLGKMKIFKAPVLGKERSEKQNKKEEKEKTKPDTKDQKRDAGDIVLYLSSLKGILNDLKGLMRYTKKKIICDRLILSLEFGKEDAAQTGILYGIIWAGIGNIFALLQSFIVIKRHRITVTPIYNQEKLAVTYEGDFKMKIHNLTVIGIKSLAVFLKYLKRVSKQKRQENKK